jgi:hypothetical protein
MQCPFLSMHMTFNVPKIQVMLHYSFLSMSYSTQLFHNLIN